MKIKTSILLCSLLSMTYSMNSFSQDWTLLGNAGTIPAINFVGTTDPFALNFRTNNFQRMTILDGPVTGGFVGIGQTFTPNQRLTVNSGDINVQDFIVPTIQNNGYRIGNVMTMW